MKMLYTNLAALRLIRSVGGTVGLGMAGCIGIFTAPVFPQILPDNSLGEETSTITPGVSIQGAPADLIEGGAVRGSNLFHSFTAFSVDNGQRLYFANPDGIENILSRVTGNSVSYIDGLLGVDGGASLFLLNPNGVIFGPDARLDIGGSFVASTANSFTLADGSQFSAVLSENELLSVSVPLGVQYNDRPQGDVVNQGELAIAPGESLTLFGNTVTHSGTLAAAGGTVQLLGDRVNVQAPTVIDVSAPTGGGTVLIGGDYRGQGVVPLAQHTQVDPGAQIIANALEHGNGGTVIVWAEDTTAFAGQIGARGTGAGNGGQVETSGQQTLTIGQTAQVDAGTDFGLPGQWLLDPSDILIDVGTATSIESSLAAGTNVELTTVGGTGGSGDIQLASDVNATATNDATLTLTASRNIEAIAGQTINVTNGNLTLNLNQEGLAAPTNPTLTNALAVIGDVTGDAIVNLGPGTYQEGATLNLDKDVTLIGAGIATTVLDGNNSYPVLEVNTDTTATIQNLTISSGVSTGSGGGIFNSGSLTLRDTQVTDNRASFGGGIRSVGGDTTIIDSTIGNNIATVVGGGIYFTLGNHSIANSTIENNSAERYGGGIANNQSTLTVTNSIINRNTSQFSGGGISGSNSSSDSGDVSIANSVISNNIAAERGGGIEVEEDGTLSITDSTLSDNEAQFGAGLFSAGTATVTRSTVSGNESSENGGGLELYSFIGTDTPSTLVVDTSTITSNTAQNNGGGIQGSRGAVTISNSTITSNSAATGGGVITSGDLEITGSLISGNTVGFGSSLTGGASNVTANGTFDNGGNNLFGQAGEAGVSGFTPDATDIVPDEALEDILETTLADNGGPTLTLALVEDSPAIDAGSGADTDQRGEGIFNEVRDIGAFEFAEEGSIPESPTTMPPTTMPPTTMPPVVDPFSGTGPFTDPNALNSEESNDEATEDSPTSVTLVNRLKKISNQVRFPTGCSLVLAEGNRFVITGRGGLPQSPRNLGTADDITVPWVTLDRDAPTATITPPTLETSRVMAEAQAIIIDADGNATLVSRSGSHVTQQATGRSSWRCAASLSNPQNFSQPFSEF